MRKSALSFASVVTTRALHAASQHRRRSRRRFLRHLVLAALVLLALVVVLGLALYLRPAGPVTAPRLVR